MQENKTESRKNYLINPQFQWKVIRWMAGLSVLNSAIYFTANLLFFGHLKTIGVEQNLPENSLYFQFLTQQQGNMNLLFLITTVVSVCVVIGFGIFSSHRIAGPIYRMCQYLRSTDPKTASKPLPDLSFREHDFFPELAEDFNDFKNKI